MLKNFVLDTNVLLHDAAALTVFEDNWVNIPIYVIEEIDQFKKDMSELGRNAREVSRELDRYRAKGSLREGVTLDNGGVIRVLFSDSQVAPDFSFGNEADSLILAAALDLQKNESERPTTLITKDTNLRIRADALGLKAADYDRERISITELYQGHAEWTLPTGEIDRLYSERSLPIPEGQEWFPNEYLTLRDAGNPRRTALARLNGESERVEKVPQFREGVWGIQPRNREQYFALDLLLRDDVKLVTLVGKAGTGKTLLAIAAGLSKATEERAFSRMLVSRPIFPLGRDIGYLPGDIEAKLGPWMQPIQDNVELLLSLYGGPDGHISYGDLLRRRVIEVEALTYIRGRSIPNQYIIIDEAQNLTPHEVKTILTRAGEGTKMVFTGDPYQIDNPYVDSMNNGLSYLANRFKSEAIAGTVTLSKGERSRLAELASNIL